MESEEGLESLGVSGLHPAPDSAADVQTLYARARLSQPPALLRRYLPRIQPPWSRSAPSGVESRFIDLVPGKIHWGFAGRMLQDLSMVVFLKMGRRHSARGRGPLAARAEGLRRHATSSGVLSCREEPRVRHSAATSPSNWECRSRRWNRHGRRRISPRSLMR